MTRALAALALGTLLACSKPAPPDPVAMKADDKVELSRLVALDVKVSKALKEADDAEKVGDAGAAVSLLDGRATPLADDAIRQVEAAKPKTEWGQAKKTEILSLLKERKGSIVGYREAVESNDPNKLLSQYLIQSELERRAIAVVAAIEEQR